ncbi:MAG: hypothetical protein RLZZ352_1036 [Pseudomonadota bacterium]|jgi:uncharacterized membrane protein
MNPSRLGGIDQLRALAMLWMTAFHFAFDLNQIGWIAQNFYRDPFWTVQRTAIVSLFLFTAGLSQAVAQAQGVSWPRFWRRWAQVAGAALLVTAGSMWMFPNSFIYFGVLHGMAVMLIIVRLTAGCGRWLWLLGAFALLASVWAKTAGPAWVAAMPALEVFNTPAWNWLGLVSRLPITEDYVPLLPWLAAIWWGMAAGQWMLRERAHWLGWQLPGRLGQVLAVLGRWSLSYYLLHQPVLLGGLMGLAWVLG